MNQPQIEDVIADLEVVGMRLANRHRGQEGDPNHTFELQCSHQIERAIQLLVLAIKSPKQKASA